jgi:hypothetical protein
MKIQYVEAIAFFIWLAGGLMFTCFSADRNAAGFGLTLLMFGCGMMLGACLPDKKTGEGD